MSQTNTPPTSAFQQRPSLLRWLSTLLRRARNAEPVRNVGWLRVYYHAIRSRVDPARREAIDALFRESSSDRSQLSELIGLLVEVSSDDALKTWRRALTAEYFVLISSPMPADQRVPEEPEDVRSQVAFLVAQISRVRSLSRSFAIMRTTCCFVAIVIAFTYFVIGLIWCIPQSDGENWRFRSLLIPITLLGGLGGLTSAIARLYKIHWRGPQLLMYTHVGSLGVALCLNLWLASFQGMVFASMLYAIFAAELVECDLFPRVTWHQYHQSWFSFLTMVGPTTPQDMGKVVIWAFLAGFSERLVPDLMRQLAAQARETSARASTGSVVGPVTLKC